MKHEGKKDNYRSELATLSRAGGDALVVIAYAGDSGAKIVRQSIEGGLFTRFIGTDGLRDEALIADVGAEARASSFFSSPTSPEDNPAQETLHEMFNAEFGEGAAMAQALRAVASAPGEKVGPDEWEKAVQLMSEGTDIDYDGAGGSYDFDENGDVAGVIGKFVVEGDSYTRTAIVE